MLQSILTIIFFFLSIFIESKAHWSYENIETWSEDNPYCAGNLQSPIDIQFDISQYDSRLQPLDFEKQDSSSDPLQLINNGHTAQLSLPNRYVLKNVAPSSEDYKVEQLHFHWSDSNDNIDGSEHWLNGQSFPLEMHVVTYSSLFSSFNDALPNTRALAVVGVFFELSDEPNEYLQPIIDTLANIQEINQQQSVSDDFDLISLIGEDRLSRYYRYDGSLTTPPCYESVIWSVLQEPIKLSVAQLEAFRALRGEENHLLEKTYRPIQPIGTRELFRSFD